MNEYLVQKSPFNTNGNLVLFVCNSFFHFKKNLFLLKLKINYRLFDPHI